MKNERKYTELQNDKEALTLLRASYYCLKNERIVKYLMIFLSFGICIAAIFNRYLPQMAPNVENIAEIQEVAATIINLISGVILVVGLVLGFYVTRMHTEATVLRDRYEAYIFNNQNPSILRPISHTDIEEYAKKTRNKPDSIFKNCLYKNGEHPKESVAQFEYISKEVHHDYRLYLSIQPFFLTIWIGFCVFVFVIALSFNDTFITTLINILFPSLSAITIIGNSWYNCRLQMKQLQNLINVIDQINKLPESKRLIYISDKRSMRALADGLFNYRASAFVIPTFLQNRFEKKNDTVNNPKVMLQETKEDEIKAQKQVDAKKHSNKVVSKTDTHKSSTAKSADLKSTKKQPTEKTKKQNTKQKNETKTITSNSKKQAKITK